MFRRRRFFKKEVVLSTALTMLLVQGLSSRPTVAAPRNEVGALSGAFKTLTAPLGGVDAFVVDDVNKRVVAASRADNAIISMDFDGNSSLLATNMADPTALAVGDGNVFALLSGAGQVVHLDPITMAPSTIVSGLVGARGLAYSNGYLYMFTVEGGIHRILLKINAATGAVATRFPFGPGSDYDLYAFTEVPDVLFVKSIGTTGGLWRFNTVDGTGMSNSSIGSIPAMLADGDLAANDGSSRWIARNAATLDLTGRRWSVTEPSTASGPSATSLASSQLAIALGAANVIELASPVDTGFRYRRYELLNGVQIAWGRLAMSRDSSKVFAATRYNSAVRFYFLPGVGVEGGASQVSQPASSARRAAPRANGLGTVRAAAPSAGSPTDAFAGWPMKDVGDIEFGTDGLVYVSDPVGDLVNAFSADGSPRSGWRELDGVDSLSELNGTMYGLLRDEGSVVRLRPEGAVRVARNIPNPSGLTAANAKLFTSYSSESVSATASMASVDPQSGTMWLDPPVYGEGFHSYDSLLSEVPIDGNLLGASSFARSSKYKLDSRSFTKHSLDLSLPFAVSPDGDTVITGTGLRATASTMIPDGTVFPGSRHAMSGSTASGKRYVAARDFSGALVVYDELNPANIVLQGNPPPYQTAIVRIEFRPGTSELWIGVVDYTTRSATLYFGDVGMSSAATIHSEFAVSEGDLAMQAFASLSTAPLPSGSSTAPASLDSNPAAVVGVTPDSVVTPLVAVSQSTTSTLVSGATTTGDSALQAPTLTPTQSTTPTPNTTQTAVSAPVTSALVQSRAPVTTQRNLSRRSNIKTKPLKPSVRKLRVAKR